MTRPPYQDPARPVEARVDDLLSRMTLEEKIGQLIQLPKQQSYDLASPDACQRGEVGSILCAVGEPVRACAEAALRSRLGIPLLVAVDAIHGHSMWHHATIFPSQLALSHAWDEQLCHDVARVTAVEAAGTGIHWTFSPVLCLPRDLRWGRVNETFGEDGLLIGRLGAAMIRGYQGDDLTAPDALAACAKHFVGYGESEGGRDGSESAHSWRTLRAVFLPPFEEAVRARAATFMSAYHATDGVPVAFNRRLLTGELRGRHGYDGVMITDWDIVGRMHRDRRICATTAEASARALMAGNDVIMASPSFLRDTLANLAAGRVTVARIDEACRRVLTLKFRLGLFEAPRLPDEALSRAACATPAHRTLARQAARRSLVLLKNRGVLPLSRVSLKRVAVLGPNSDDWANTLGDWQLGAGLGHGARDAYPPGSTVTVLAGLRQLLGERIEVVHGLGCGVAAPLAVTDRGMPRYVDAPVGSGLDEAAPERIAHAVRLAASADAVVLVLGDRLPFAGETKSTATLELPGEQRALFEAVRATGTPLVVVLLTSKPLAIPDVAARADAILLAHHPGMEAGTAIAEALLGDLNPSGKLTLSWPHHVGQQPVRYDQAPGAHQAGYPDLSNATFDALFPFGFGLSYTTVRYFGLRLAKTELAAGDAVEAEVSVTNRGNVATDEIVQCYLADRYTSVVWPAKKLKAWQRVSLAPGAVAQVRFTIPFASLALCDEDGEWTVEPGAFQLLVGGSSRDGDLLRADFVVREA